jgi:hypothetical protein
MTDMTKADRDALIRIAKGRAKQARTNAKTREKILVTEVLEQAMAEYDARDKLWDEAVRIAEEYVVKANAQIQARCVDLGIPPKDAPKVQVGWVSRSERFSNPNRRAELLKLAEKRAATLTAMTIAAVDQSVLDIEERLIVGGMDSDEARASVESMPSPEELMPPLSLRDIGVKQWQPDEDAAAKLSTPRSTADWRERQILRAIEANPGASDRAIGQIVGCDHKTVAKHRRERGEIPAIGGESPTSESDAELDET